MCTVNVRLRGVLDASSTHAAFMLLLGRDVNSKSIGASVDRMPRVIIA
jgi:hypothetical protein